MSDSANSAPAVRTRTWHARRRVNPPKLCRKIEKNGFCDHHKCLFGHPEPCKTGRSCTKDVCEKPHPVPKCPQGDTCPRGECELRHPAQKPADVTDAVALPEPDGDPVSDPVTAVPRPKTKCEIIRASLDRKFQAALDECDADVIKMRDQIWDLHENADDDNRNTVLQHTAAIEAKIQQIELLRETACNAVELALKRPEPDAIDQYRREIFRLQNKLPALAKRADFANAVRQCQFIVVRGETGSGKSTQLTQYLLDMPEFYGRKVLCTQPRKIAAVSLAERVAYEFAGGFDKAKAGGYVGYRVGSAQKASPKTCIEYLTESMLLKLLNNPSKKGDPLKACCAVIIDEAHIRSINTDVLMGLLKREIHRWPHLKVIVTSATINTALFSRYFHNCPVVEIPGRLFPVNVVYRPYKGDVLPAVVQEAVQLCEDRQSEGHILCFLTGQKEVETAAESARVRLAKATNIKVHCLYGKQMAAEQREVFGPVDAGIRKLIFATDVAETSVTIDGVRTVIDCGLTKNKVFDNHRKVSVLKEMTISRTSAIQRKGRAGRTAPGVCYRLYGEGVYRQMAEADQAEIFSTPLSITVAVLKAMNVDPFTFDWIERPKEAALNAAEEELMYFNAIDDQGNLTDLGQVIAELQIDPGIANMIQYACTKGLGETAIELAALFSVSSMVFWRGGNDASRKAADEKKLQFASEKGDIVSIYHVFQHWKQIKDQHKQHQRNKEGDRKNAITPGQWCQQNYINNKAMEMAVNFIKEVGSPLRHTAFWSRAEEQDRKASEEEIQQLVLQALLLNIACLVNKTYVSVMNRVVGYVHPGSVLFLQEASSLPKVIVFQTIMRTSRMFVSQLTPIDWKWLKENNDILHAIYREECLELHIADVRVDNVGRSHLGLIVGHGRNSRVNSLNTQLNCFLHVDYDNEALVAWCKPRDTQRVENGLRRLVEDARKQCRLAVVEDLLIGRTRILWGCGGVAASLLFGKDFASLNIRNVPDHLSMADLQSLVAMATDDHQMTRDVVRKCYAYPKKGDEETNSWRVFVKDPQAAEKAVKALDGYDLEGYRLEAAPATLHAPSTFRETCGFLKVSFATAPSNGTALLMYETAEEANRVLIQRPYPLNFIAASREQKYSNPPTDGSGYFLNVPAKKNQKFVLYASRLPKYLDEEDIASNLTAQGLPLPFYICVARNKQPGAADVSPEDVVNQNSLAPIVERVTQRVPFTEGKRNRAGVKVFYDSVEDVQLSEMLVNHKRISDQPVRYETGFTTTVIMNRDLYDVRKTEFDNAVKEARSSGIRIHINPKRRDNRVAINIEAGTVEELETVRKTCNTILSFTVFKNPNQRLLFTTYGQKRLGELLKQEPLRKVFIHRNCGLQTISIYGASDLQKQAARELDDLVKQLETAAVEKQVLIRRNSLPHVANKLNDYKKNFPGLVDIHLVSNRLIVTGTAEATQGLETMLEQFQLSVKPKQVEKGECGICFDTLLDFVTLELCNHKFCLECIRPMLEQLDLTVPIKCPYDKCETPLSVKNIQEIATPTALERMKQVAVLKLIKEKPALYAECFQKGCPQYLPVDVRTKKLTSLEQVRFGGYPVACDHCAAWYCANCSVALQAPVKRHRGLNCAQRMADHEDEAQRDVRMHRLYIVEKICTLHCPRCQGAFDAFEGCCALTCSCGAAFCFFCFQDCGRNAHAHVARCAKNPNPGELYLQGGVSQTKVHSASRKRSIIQYLVDKCRDLQFRKDLLEAIQIDIKDLDISIRPEEVGLPNESIERHKKHIIEEILTVKCPRCKTVLRNGNGIVKCGGCSEGFCYICFQCCGLDMERHAASFHGGYSLVALNRPGIRVQRIKDNIIEYLITYCKDTEERSAVLNAVQYHLGTAGITISLQDVKPSKPAASVQTNPTGTPRVHVVIPAARPIVVGAFLGPPRNNMEIPEARPRLVAAPPRPEVDRRGRNQRNESNCCIL